MTDDLITWLRAQLDADEAEIAKHPDGEGAWVPDGLYAGREQNYPCDPYLGISKRRALAEVDAKRRILDAYAETIENYGYVRFGEWESCSDDCPEIVLGEVVKLLALPYADRPGWQPEWAAPLVEIRPIPKSASTEGSS